MNAQASAVTGRRIRVRGLVQGVGFRPHVWRLARDFGLGGHVLNDGAGVEIDAWGGAEALDAFCDRLAREAPPLARIATIDTESLVGKGEAGPFRIVESARGRITTGIVPDAATCPACLAEVLDATDRRHGYAFTNCTHCGPRLSIVRAIPYDRAATSMSAFTMCLACRAEYENPADRRFHAQPNACPDCGPRIWLEGRDGQRLSADPIAAAAVAIRTGEIVAIKGIGGFHLACDASSEAAVDALRRRKQRDAKPLAVMVRDVAAARRLARVSVAEAALLESPAAPIVLLSTTGTGLASGIAPGHDHIGILLPYTPLHHLLMRAVDGPIVLTSGNRSDAPQAIDDEDARTRLAGIADRWLMHDRAIVNRLDDTVMRIDKPGPAVLRRARGLAPAPIRLADGFAEAPQVLAMGGELKAAFCLLKDGQAILSQHIGDLEDAATHADYRKTLDLYRVMFDAAPAVIAVDRHPDYLSTQWGLQLAGETGARIVAVQHHHAHLAACLAEHGVEPGDDGTLGIVLDGIGLGTDGTIWGGEVLLGGYTGVKRVGHFAPVALPGGARAVREPWRNTAAHFHATFGCCMPPAYDGTAIAGALASKPLGVLERMIESGLNTPMSSSAGRLFDAMAAVLGICVERQAYEGQAAMQLEALARSHVARESGYPVECAGRGTDGDPRRLSWRPLWEAVAFDLKAGAAPGRIAARFHLGLIDALVDAVQNIAAARPVGRIALSGGVLQNRILLDGLHGRLQELGMPVLSQHAVPAGDGGLAFGQAAIAAALAVASAEAPVQPDGER